MVVHGEQFSLVKHPRSNILGSGRITRQCLIPVLDGWINRVVDARDEQLPLKHEWIVLRSECDSLAGQDTPRQQHIGGRIVRGKKVTCTRRAAIIIC